VLLPFSLASLAIAYGEWRIAPLPAALGSAFGFAAEYLGLHYGALFGSYTYLKLREAMVLDVPVPVILAWGIYLYTSYLVASAVVEGRWRRALATPASMVLPDLALDPAMVSTGFWEWRERGPWFGVPLTNFLGWFIVSLAACLAYAALSGEEPRSSPALYLPYLAAYAQILYVARGVATLAVVLSFTIAVAIFASALRST
jgi:putative membrane protein